MLKRILKYVGIGLGVILVAAGAFGLFVNFSDLPTYDVAKVDLKVVATPARLERGKKLASMLCAGCHLNQATGQLSGQRMHDIPDVFGKVWSQNITNDKTYGIGSWTDGEILHLLRTGIHRTGRYVPPYMIKLPNMADEDLESIIAFLRSDDQLVRAAAIPDTACEPSFLAKMLSRTVFSAYEMPAKPIALPDVNDKVAHGRYLVANLGCFHCHSSDITKSNDLQPEQTEGFMGGGAELKDLAGNTIYTPNITMDKTHGIGNWTEQQFIRAVRDGFRPDNSLLKYPMERFPLLTDDELSAMFNYIKSIPALANPRKQNPAKAVNQPTTASEGERLYQYYSCYACHGNDGAGNCDLREAHSKYADDSTLIAWIRNPGKMQPGSRMPNWEGVIKEEEFKPLADYVRQLGMKSGVTKAGLH